MTDETIWDSWEDFADSGVSYLQNLSCMMF